MPSGERLAPEAAQGLLLGAGFEWIRSKGSHRIYRRGAKRVVIPFHSVRTLHPKIIKQIRQAISEEPQGPIHL